MKKILLIILSAFMLLSLTSCTENKLNSDGSLPKGSYYVNILEETIYDTMPDIVKRGDVFLYGDYCYEYLADEDGWAVHLATNDLVLKEYILEYVWTDRNQTSYGLILESINDKAIINMSQTFYNCTALEIAPAIPDSVITLYESFGGCIALKAAPDIPGSVVNLEKTFSGCKSLTKASTIPSNAIYIYDCFAGCTSLTGKVKVNANPAEPFCFRDTEKPILITGSCSEETKSALVASANNGNVSY